MRGLSCNRLWGMTPGSNRYSGTEVERNPACAELTRLPSDWSITITSAASTPSPARTWSRITCSVRRRSPLAAMAMLTLRIAANLSRRRFASE